MIPQQETQALIDRAIAIATDGCEGPWDDNCHEYPAARDQWCAGCVLEDLAKALEALSESSGPEEPTPVAEAFDRVRSLVRSEAGHIAYLDDALDELVEVVRAESSSETQAAERTAASIAAMLGWGNVPPQATLEAEIRALKARVSEGAQLREVLADTNEALAACQSQAGWYASTLLDLYVTARAHGIREDIPTMVIAKQLIDAANPLAQSSPSSSGETSSPVTPPIDLRAAEIDRLIRGGVQPEERKDADGR